MWVATRPVDCAPPSSLDRGVALHHARLTSDSPLVLHRAAPSPAGPAGSHRKGQTATVPRNHVGRRNPTVFTGPPAAGQRRPMAVPGREELPTGGGGGGLRGLPLGSTPADSRVGDVPPASLPRGGDQPRRRPPGAPTTDPGGDWPSPISSFPTWTGAVVPWRPGRVVQAPRLPSQNPFSHHRTNPHRGY